MTNTISEKILTKRDFPFNNPFISSSSQFNKDFEQICCNEIGGIKQNFPRNVTSNVHHYNMSAVFFLIYLLWPKSLRENSFSSWHRTWETITWYSSSLLILLRTYYKPDFATYYIRSSHFNAQYPIK